MGKQSRQKRDQHQPVVQVMKKNPKQTRYVIMNDDDSDSDTMVRQVRRSKQSSVWCYDRCMNCCTWIGRGCCSCFIWIVILFLVIGFFYGGLFFAGAGYNSVEHGVAGGFLRAVGGNLGAVLSGVRNRHEGPSSAPPNTSPSPNFNGPPSPNPQGTPTTTSGSAYFFNQPPPPNNMKNQRKDL